ncbi:MAG: prephenate dehydrogenase [Bacteroidaceae bacterium]|nr:prephenate dehydrogenase [Bacteroidaceae bacterium]
MIVGVVGLGLIGGSIAKAYKEAGETVYGYDINETITNFAMLSGDINGKLDDKTIGKCQIIHIATYPEAAINYMTDHASQFGKDCIVMDDCGTKRKVCTAGFDLAKQYGFTYVGAHPMAGTKFSGYKYSRASMFNGAPMIIVPPTFDDINLYDRLKQLLAPLQLKNLVFTTADDHDQMIAFTSQLAHVVSNAYVKSPSAQRQKGYSAGSFRDLTRVAWLNEQMWTELFLENKDNLISEITTIIDNLSQYRDAMQNDDAETLRQLLRDGRIAKEQCG